MSNGGPLRVLIRVDAGPDIGVGHAMRCSTLAAALRRSGHDVVVATCELVPFVRDRFERAGVDVVDIGDSPAVEATDLATFDACVVDGYLLARDVVELGAARPPLLVIDDNYELPVEHGDLVLNQNLHAESVPYPTSAGLTLLLGPEYALIRDDVVRIERTPDRSGHVLVSFGGSDTARLTLPVVARLLQTGSGTVAVALSPAHDDFDALAALAAGSGGRLQFATSDLVAAMSSVDAAIIGGGSTLWEVAYLGIPSVAAIVADNQVQGTMAAAAAGFVQPVDCRSTSRDSSAQHCVDAVDVLRHDPVVAAAIVDAGRSLFDGGGADRLVTEIELMARR